MREELSEARREMAIDGLTQVYNRRAFDEALEQNVTLGSLSGQTLVLMMVDIDYFKTVNDTRGHTAGDLVLRELAGRILRLFPRRRDFVARYGGEEFAIILPDADVATAPILAERVLGAVREQSFALEPPLWLTCSVGYAALRGREGATDLLARADRALYRAKHQGRDCAVGSDELESADLAHPQGAQPGPTAQLATLAAD
jgi:diguanylate cyclase